MRSVRLAPELEQRLAGTARRLDTSESEVIRLALERYFEVIDQADAGDDQLAFIRGWEERWHAEGLDTQPQTDYASNSHRLYAELLQRDGKETHGPKGRAAKGLRRIAEGRAGYDTSPTAD